MSMSVIDKQTNTHPLGGNQERQADYAAAANHLIVRNGDGSTEGRNPRALTQAELKIAGHLPQPILKIIRAKCSDCSGYSRAEVARCTAVGCALWPYRLGSNPY